MNVVRKADRLTDRGSRRQNADRASQGARETKMDLLKHWPVGT